MSDKIDLAEIDSYIAAWLKVSPVKLVEITSPELLAFIRVTRAAKTYFNHLENEGFCNQTITQPDGRETCAIVEEMRNALAAFTDSAKEDE